MSSSDRWGNARIQTKEEGLEQAKQIAEEMVSRLRRKGKAGILINEETFNFAAERFTMEYGLITDKRNGDASCCCLLRRRLRLALVGEKT